MATFSDFTDFQLVFTNENIYNYSPRPSISFDDFTDFQMQLTENMVQNYEIKQYGNFHLRKETTTNIWVGVNDINLNPKGEATTQAVLDTYSGSAGKVTFTDQELYALVTAAGGDILLVYAETLDAVLAVDIIADGNQNTNLAQVTTSAGIPIWSYNLI